jgi:hypothetical protein
VIAGVAPKPAPAAKASRRKERPGRPGRPPRRRKRSDDFLEEEGFTEEGGTRARRKRRPATPEEYERLKRVRARRKKKRLQRLRESRLRPSPPLQPTDPLAAYLAGEMVPCPVGCGGFSEVVRVGTGEDGSGEIWFECLSCAQRRRFDVPAATPEERRAVITAAETEGHEALCPRHGRPVPLRRRGKDFVCPECGVIFPE